MTAPDLLRLDPGELATISVDEGRCAVVTQYAEPDAAIPDARTLLSGAVDYVFGAFDSVPFLRIDGPTAIRVQRPILGEQK